MSTGRQSTTDSTSSRPESRGPWRRIWPWLAGVVVAVILVSVAVALWDRMPWSATASGVSSGCTPPAADGSPSSSAEPVYLIDYTTGDALPETGNNWKTTPVGLLPVPSDRTGTRIFVDPAKYDRVFGFIATPGTEDDPPAWLGSGGSGGWASDSTPNDFTDNPAVAGDFHDTLAACGGTYSIGQAWVIGAAQGPQDVVKVVYTTVVLGPGSADEGGSLSWTVPKS